MKNLKKWLAVLLAVALLMSLTACVGSSYTVYEGGNAEGSSGCEHEVVVDAAVSATCTEDGLTEGKHCSKCDEVLVKQEKVTALGHTTETGTCTRCNQSFGYFATHYYVDEFDQPTADGYVANDTYFVGKFSNSATNDSKLYVTVCVDKDSVVFFLYEYGRYQVKNSSSQYSDKYDIIMKTEDGTRYEFSGRIYAGGDRLFVEDDYEAIVLNALKSGGVVSFHITESDRTTTTYLFSVQTTNFAEEYAKLFG